MDGGIGLIRYLMEDVKPAEFASKEIAWVVSKHLLLAAIVRGGMLSLDYFNRDNSFLLGRYAAEIDLILRKAGIGFEPFGDLTEKGWEKLKSITGVSI